MNSYGHGLSNLTAATATGALAVIPTAAAAMISLAVIAAVNTAMKITTNFMRTLLSALRSPLSALCSLLSQLYNAQSSPSISDLSRQSFSRDR